MENQILLAATSEEKKNAPEFAALEASAACATFESTTEYSTEPRACQIAVAPTLEEIEREIAAAAQQRIEAALRDLNVTRARIERERTARDSALKAAQERASKTRAELDGLAAARAAMEHRAQTFLAGDALKDTQAKIHLAFNARQLELEDALAIAEADAREIQDEIRSAAIADALEIQFAEQTLEQLETAAPDVATNVRLAATAEEHLAATLQAVKDGRLRDAEVLLEKARRGNADPARVVEAEQSLAEARRNQMARDLIARVNAIADQPGAIKRIRELIDEAQAAGVADKVALFAERALKTARAAAHARFAQARPIANHLASEGFIPVVGDGRIEVWQQISNNGHGVAWTLERVMMLRENVWKSETPRVPITRKELPPRVRHSRWYRTGASPTE
jgi:hypothetical protein